MFNSISCIRIYLINFIVIFFTLIINVYIHSLKSISVNIVDNQQVVTMDKTYAEYIPLLTIISIIVVSITLIVSIIYLTIEYNNLRKHIKEFILLLEQSNGDKIVDPKTKLSKQELMIIRRWNNNIEQLSKVNDKRDDYFKKMIHDFKAPIHIIKGNIKLFFLDTKDSKPIDVVDEEIRLLEKEIEKFLVLEKIDYFEYKHNTSFKISELIDKLVNAFQSNGIKINVTYHDKNIKYYTDKVMLKKTIENLVENAILHGSSKTISVEVFKNKLQVINSISSDIKLDDVFSTPNRPFSELGNGLGVGIIKKYAEINSWNIKGYQQDDTYIVELDIENIDINDM